MGLGGDTQGRRGSPSKLWIVVPNAFRPNANNAMRYGPVMFALKDGSPMFGLIHNKSVIVSIDRFHGLQ
jgi:hypothetical protein